MQRLGERIILSASDLNDFLACEHLTDLELRALGGALERPMRKSAQAEILSHLGDVHESRYLQQLRDAGVEVVDIDRAAPPDSDRLAHLRTLAQATVDAMRAGVEAIYQATFFDGDWLGHADILKRVEEPSNLGPWSYEVEDTKLARSLKPYFLVQLCFYSACVERIQGRRPERMHVVLGDGTRRSFRVDEFSAYQRAIQRRLEERVTESPTNPTPTYPYPVSHCSLCVWDAKCSLQRKRDDSLTEVAGVTRLQDRRLAAGGITTLAALGRAGANERPTSMEPATFEKLARQARLQLEQRVAKQEGDPNPYRCELLAPEDEGEKRGPRGFALLPTQSAGDIFFDMEGDPFYDVAEGLEYLFGAHSRDEGFVAFWGCDRGSGPWRDRLAEKRAFENFVDFAMARRARHPDMHIYHYAPYEKRALQSLAQRHATREDEVDILLREERLVDLLRVVRQSVVVGQPGYGLKKMEALFGGRDALAIAAGDESVIEFERWRVARDQGESEASHAILANIEAYNRQDCVSTSNLLDWLHERRLEAQRRFDIEFPPFTASSLSDDPDAAPKPDVHADVKARLQANVPDDFDPDSAPAGDPAWPFWSTLQLLDYHRREEKPEWWAFFDRCDTFNEDPLPLLDDGMCILGLALAGEPVVGKRSTEYALTFPPQEIKVDTGTPYDPAIMKKTGTRVAISNGEGFLSLVRGPKYTGLPMPSAVVVHDVFPSRSLRSALARFADAMLGGAPRDGRYRAAYDLLSSAYPRLRDRPAGAMLQPQNVDASALSALIAALDESYLFIQGPPGSGKTYQGAHAIATLLAQGKRVGVTANSHKAINNLLAEVDRVAHERNVPFEGQRKHNDDADCYKPPNGRSTTIINTTERFVLGEGGL